MTPSTRGYRRAARLLAGAAAASALLLSGCAAGQIAATATKSTSINGLNIDSPDGSVSLRNLSLPYPGTDGYPAGGDVPIEVAIYNNTTEPIAVRVGAAPADDGAQETVVEARTVVLGGSVEVGPTAEPTGGPEPTGLPQVDLGREAIIQLPAGGWTLFTADSPEPLRITGLSRELTAGHSVNLIFEFSDGSAPLIVPAPVNVPLSPAPRAPAEHAEEGH
ncbi:hypothetical protein ACN27F_15425 [Solwaraspora sp. WMMB335]|uniref:hypothetical protein n=1 Tax=Solwaraspora sp. WMMB335 TaxID=3404118 RepID=UPI003B94146E